VYGIIEKSAVVANEVFEELVGLHDYADLELMPLEQFRSEFRQALAESGYHSRDDVVDLVRQVKRELATERSAVTEEQNVSDSE
jgi:hypothetical protein